MVPFDRWMDDMTILATHEWTVYRQRLWMDEFNYTWDVFIETIVTHKPMYTQGK